MAFDNTRTENLIRTSENTSLEYSFQYMVVCIIILFFFKEGNSTNFTNN